MPPEYSKECECWALSMFSLSHLTRHTHRSKEAPSGNQDMNLQHTVYAAFAKYHYFSSQTLTNSWSPLGSISSLWRLWAESYFRSSLCSCIKTLERLSFAARGEVQTSASSVDIWKCESTPTPCTQGQRRVVSLFSSSKDKLKYNRSFHWCTRKKSPTLFTSLDV